MSLVYGAALLVSTGCIALLDARWRLALWRAPGRSLLALAITVAVLVVWDIVGIAAGVFLHLPSAWASGIMLGPAFPIEELLFLVFLGYLTLVLLGAAQAWKERQR